MSSPAIKKRVSKSLDPMQRDDKTNLIHFTYNFNAIAGILSDRAFRLKYCKEEFSFGKKKVSSAVHAMVCFSSYSANQLSATEITYGRYGISLTEEWAQRKGVHEVLYLERNSTPARALATLLEARRGKRANFPNDLRLPVMQIRCFVKNAKGRNTKAKRSEFDFRSEHEWRFIPSNSQIGGSRFSENQSTYEKQQVQMNAKMWQHKLLFTMEDIVQIYVDNQTEINQLASFTGINSKFIKVSPWKYNEFTPTKKK
jgi:hypothetical protein